MDRRTLLRGGVALTWSALMPAADLVSLDDMAARTHVLRRREEEARPGSVEALETHAAALAGLMRWSPRPGLASVVAEACGAAALVTCSAGRFEAAARWAMLGRQVALDADDPDMYALNATRITLPLLELDRPKDALQVLDGVGLMDDRQLSPYALLFVEVHRARGAAAVGDLYTSVAAIDRADVALDRAVSEEKPSWARTVGPNWLASWRAMSALQMNRPHLAEQPLRQVIANAPARLARSRAEARLNLAYVAWARDDLEETCELLKGSVPVLRRVGANRQLRRVHNLRRGFTPHAGSRHVRALDEVLMNA